jgi:hypothetical protein
MLQAVRRIAVAAIVMALARTTSADTQACIASAERGEQLRRDGHLHEAQGAFIACQRAECPNAIVKDCTRWLEETQRSQPTVVVRALDPRGHEVTDVTLSIDGSRVALDGRAIPLDPGHHALRVDWSGGPPTTLDLLAREGEHERLVDVQLRAAVTTEPRAETSHVPWPAWILGGAGLVAIGVGASLWAVGLNERAQLFDTCGITRVCTNDDKASAQSKLIAGDVTFFAGVTLVVVGSIWLIANATRHAHAPATVAIRF